MPPPIISAYVPEFNDVKMAAKRIKGHALRTELLNSPVIDLMCGMEVWFKAECLQKVGAFKYRGAYNRLSAMTPDERKRGVVAFSSGNHAQGVSRSAKELGMSAIIVMPEDAPSVKVKGVRNDGGEIVFYDRLTESREQIAADIAERDSRILVSSYDDAYIIAGQGTVGLEIAESGRDFDALVTCIGGGGLCAGISLAMNALSPKTKIYGAEPEHYNDHQRSLAAGKRVSIDNNPPPTLCDAIMAPIPGELTWQINSKSLSGVFGVRDRDCLLAMAVAKKELGVQLEPGGAAAMAAVLTGKLPKSHKKVVAILSGGNVDADIAERGNKMFGL